MSEAFAVPESKAFSHLAQWSLHQGLPRLRHMGVDQNALAAIARAAQGSSSMRGNPVVLSVEQLLQIMDSAW